MVGSTPIDTGVGTMEPIAIVGFAAQLPQGHSSSDAFWKLLREGRSARSEIPTERFHVDAFYHPDTDRPDTIPVRHGHFLADDLAAFDAPFFSIQRAEARSMDPQQRLMLETAYRALENAGWPLERIAGSQTGVFVGASARDYETLLLRDPDQPAKYVGTGIGTSMLANRLSWFFDLRGPSVALDTACSSSLNALHLACQSIRSGEADAALVGGCNLIVAPDVAFVHLSNMGFFSPDGICYTFDERANGYAKGEGVGVVVVKRLSRALQDGDCIRAIIRATGANQDGRTPGLTLPSQQAQTDNIIQTYQAAGLDLASTGHFEAHGTGTPVGDVLEAAAINGAFKRGPDNPLSVGALKPNIGHLEAASGVAGIIKAILMLEHGQIPPNAWYETTNPSIPADEWNLQFPTELRSWPTKGLRRLSLNSFGYGGSNAHAVLDDAHHYLESQSLSGRHRTCIESPDTDGSSGAIGEALNASEESQRALKVFMWSAFDEATLQSSLEAYQTHLNSRNVNESGSPSYFNDLAFTLSDRRSVLPWKSFVVTDSLESLRDDLVGTASKPVRSSTPPPLLFVFTGQGAQWYAMGRELSSYQVYKDSLNRSSEVLEKLGCEWSLIDELLRNEEASRVNEPELSQPSCTAVQLALVNLLSSWGVRPTAVVGHSSGEIAAAYCAGDLSFESAIKVAYLRGKLSSQLAKSKETDGAMTSVAVSEKEATLAIAEAKKDVLKGRVEIGCVNSAKNVTLTGDRPNIEALNKRISATGVFARTLAVTVAYHSHHMLAIAEDYRALLGELVRGSNSGTKVPMFSSVTGQEADCASLSSADYWVANMKSQVKFSDALGEALGRVAKNRPTGSNTGILEIGPHAALQRPIKDTTQDLKEVGTNFYFSLLSRGTNAMQSCLSAMGNIYCKGYPVNLSNVNSSSSRPVQRTPLANLPFYPFNHSQKYWQESRISQNYRYREHARHDLLGNRSSDWNEAEAKWRNTLRTIELPWIQDHKFGEKNLFPAAGMLVMAIEGLRQLAGPRNDVHGWVVKGVKFVKPLIVNNDTDGTEIQLNLHPKHYSGSSVTECRFSIYALFGMELSRVCEGTVSMDRRSISITEKEKMQARFAECRRHCQETVNMKQYYDNVEGFGYQFGQSFQSLQSLKYGNGGMAMGRVGRAETFAKVNSHATKLIIHPTELDGILQLGTACVSEGSWASIPLFIPTQISYMRISESGELDASHDEISSMGWTTFKGYREADFSFLAFDQNQDVRVKVEGFRETAASSNLGYNDASTPVKPICYHLEWKPDVDLMTNYQVETLIRRKVSKSFGSNGSGDHSDARSATCFAVTAYLELLLHKNPRLRIMHLTSSGDAKETSILRGLVSAGSFPLSSRYVYASKEFTDSDALRVGLQDITAPMFFEELDVSADIADNELEAQRFDVVIKSIESQLSYGSTGDLESAQKHLVNGGKLLLYGSSNRDCSQPVDHADSLKVVLDHLPAVTTICFYDDASNTQAGLHVGFANPSTARNGVNGAHRANVTNGVNGFHHTNSHHTNDHLKANGNGFPRRNGDRLANGIVLANGDEVTKEPSNTNDTGQTNDVTSTEETPTNGVNEHKGTQILGNGAVFHKVNGIQAATKESELSQSGADCYIAIASTSEEQSSVSRALALSLPDITTKTIDFLRLAERDLSGAKLIFLLELDATFFENISSQNYDILQKVIRDAASVLWVTLGCGEPATRPERGIVTGFGRNVASETWDLRFVELALEENTTEADAANHIRSIYRHVISSAEEKVDTEYIEVDGVLCIGRVHDTEDLNHALHMKLIPQSPELIKKSDATAFLKLTVGMPGVLDTLHFEDNEAYDAPLGDEEVEIQVSSIGMNFKDIMISLGRVAGNHLGFECAGKVTRAGTQSKFLVGKNVCCFTTNGAFGTHVQTHSSAVALIPSGMSLFDAASIPVVFCTAYYGLVVLGRLSEGDSVLIHSGAGGVGQAAIQIAQWYGARVFTTTSTSEKRKLLMQTYNIPEDHIFSSRDTNFATAIIDAVGGPDIVLNSLSGEVMRASWSCIAPLGRFVELSRSYMDAYDELSTEPFARNATFAAFDLALVFEQSKRTMQKIFSKVMDGFRDATQPLRPVHPVHRFPVSKVIDAFRYMQGGKNTGKIVVDMDDDSMILARPSTRPEYTFDANATYVIAGGLGGLGRAITQWMVDRGAKHFLILSRSEASAEAAKKLVQGLSEREVEVQTPRCDVSIEEDIVATLSDYGSKMPPIRGCIQSAMVLKDNFFAKMSHADFTAVLRPKVQGSWNLHKHLPSTLSFFLLLSSISSTTGSRAQANYAAANGYQNALARHRVSRGLPALALNLGPIMGVGKVAEGNLGEILKREGFEGVRKSELLALLDWACHPARNQPREQPWRTQIITGLSATKTLPASRLQEIYWTRKPLFCSAVSPPSSGEADRGADSEKVSHAAALKAAASEEETVRVALDALIARLARLLDLPAEDIDPVRPIHAFGIDSLVGVEIKYWIEKEIRADVAILEIMSAPSLHALAQTIATKSAFRKKE